MADHDPSEMFRAMPWPFSGDVFPEQLGAVIQRTVLDDALPALVVIHDADGSWIVGDGVNDPNLPGAVVASHIRHVVRQDGSLASLATMPPGTIAERATIADDWEHSPFSWDDEESSARD